jgi:hypothetical protein
VIVYTPLATSESVDPARYAIALIVVVADTAIAPVYSVPVVDVGVEPSIVYRMLAPEVVVESVTLCALVYVPAATLNAGAETVGIAGSAGVESGPPHPQRSIAVASRANIVGTVRLMEFSPLFQSLDGTGITGTRAFAIHIAWKTDGQ